jgi:septal ring factor EnvC (AmiA/AmiB activator)
MTSDIATEIVRLELERDEIDGHWRSLRYAAVNSPEERYALNTALAALEVAHAAASTALARLHVDALELRLASILEADHDALTRAEADHIAARLVFDELQQQHRAVHVQRRDAGQDLKAAQRTLAESEATLEHRRRRQAEAESRPIRGPLPAAMWVGDGRW